MVQMSHFENTSTSRHILALLIFRKPNDEDVSKSLRFTKEMIYSPSILKIQYEVTSRTSDVFSKNTSTTLYIPVITKV